jgi:hypothetical protein
VCIAKIRLTDSTRWSGRYNSVFRTIALDSSLADDELPAVLRHEVCHAIDLQWGVLESDRTAFAYREGLGPERHRDKAVEREAVAEVCAIGETALGWLAAVDCPNDEPGALDAVRVVLDEVYDAPQAAPRPVTVTPVAQTDLGEWHPPSRLQVVSYPDERALDIRLSTDEVSLYTLRQVDTAMGHPPIPSDGITSDGAAPDLPHGVMPLQWYDVPGRPGEQIVLAASLLPQGRVVRLLSVGGEGVDTLDVCVAPGSALARTNDAVYLVRAEWPDVVWETVVPEP